MREKIISVLFYVVVIVISSYILVELFLPTKTLDYFGFKTYVVVSNSMEPDINVNDLIVIKDVDEDELEVRDVITFEVYLPELGDKGVVTHYLGDIEKKLDGTKIYYTQGALREQGDYDEWTDEYGNQIALTYEDISGEVILTVPYVGYIIGILKDIKMVALLALNAGIIYLIVTLIRSTKQKETSSSN
ncbi:signal peptidase I [Haloplasma contractile]|uniref:Signal peptidase I n=1 Tax=Haloplasma contractile SSD-17B TaxID=1033810 RepID=U2FFE0_9MOLU|nr:signal peptidase I [Haloplasma contractile]ERJ11635.1 Peptidase S26B signal peptidase protein [Haloplasma contractile SSD-17B]